MNRRDRRATLVQQHRDVSALPEQLTLIPRDEYPPFPPPLPALAWRSKRYMAQLYEEEMEYCACPFAVCDLARMDTGMMA